MSEHCARKAGRMTTSAREFTSAFYQSLRLAVRSAPKESALLVFLQILQGASPAVALVLTKIIVDAASPQHLHAGTFGNIPLIVTLAVIGFVASEIINDFAETLSGFVLSTMGDRTEGVTRRLILDKISSFNDISLFENPELLDRVHLAKFGIANLRYMIMMVSNFMMGAFSFLPIFLLAYSIAWWVPFLIFLTGFPSIFWQGRLEQKTWSLAEAQAETVRNKDIQEQFLTDQEYAKELRLYSLQQFFLSRWDTLFQGALGEMLALRRKSGATVILWSTLSGVGVAVSFVYVVNQVFSGHQTLGNLAVFTGLIFQVRRILFILLGNASQLFSICLKTKPLFALLATPATIISGHASAEAAVNPETDSLPPVSRGVSLTFQDIGFSYLGSDKQVLHGIDLHIASGETVAIVGENGAGKTTLSKLACRLYDPTLGAILWDEHDLRSLDIDSLRRNIAYVAQDYAKFSASLRENMALGWLPSIDDDKALLEAVREVGLESVLGDMTQGLDTLLGTQLEGGRNLSGGQWQRVALGRTLLRYSQARLLIFDEPTAALDPKTEYDILSLFRKMAAGCTSIIITHRLSLARTCDRIVVLSLGDIVEVGTHGALMDKQGLYFEMFTQQASSYLDL